MEYYIRKTESFYLFHDHISTQVTLISLLAPLDRIKTIIQTQHSNPAQSITFPNARSLISHLTKKQGLVSLWRGNLLPLLLFPPFKLIHQHIHQQTQSLDIFDPSSSVSSIEKFLLSTSAIWIYGLLLYPALTIKTQMNLEVGEKKDFKSIPSYFSKISKIKKSELYSGFFFTYYLPYGISQIIEDKVKARMGSEAIRNSWVFGISMIVTGGIIKAIVYPFETVQYRLMLNSGSSEKRFRSPGDMLSHIMRTEGYKGLFKGFGLDLLGTVLRLLYISYNNSYF